MDPPPPKDTWFCLGSHWLYPQRRLWHSLLHTCSWPQRGETAWMWAPSPAAQRLVMGPEWELWEPGPGQAFSAGSQSARPRARGPPAEGTLKTLIEANTAISMLEDRIWWYLTLELFLPPPPFCGLLPLLIQLFQPASLLLLSPLEAQRLLNRSDHLQPTAFIISYSSIKTIHQHTCSVTLGGRCQPNGISEDLCVKYEYFRLLFTPNMGTGGSDVRLTPSLRFDLRAAGCSLCDTHSSFAWNQTNQNAVNDPVLLYRFQK